MNIRVSLLQAGGNGMLRLCKFTVLEMRYYLRVGSQTHIPVHVRS